MRSPWAALPLSAWKETYETLHLWTQIVGKVRLKFSPLENHWWNVALYVTPRGLTTSPIPYEGSSFQIDFDFIDHALLISTDRGSRRSMALAPKSVAAFYFEFLDLLDSLGIKIKINTRPQEIPSPINFDQDHEHASYDRKSVERFHEMMVRADQLLKKSRSASFEKHSPVHFFWGSFDLAFSRFSGRLAPKRPEADRITEIAYSHEVASCGFWPGSGNITSPAFYAYAAPEPEGFNQISFGSIKAFYNLPTRGFVLLCDDLRASSDPDQEVLEFFGRIFDLKLESRKVS